MDVYIEEKDMGNLTVDRDSTRHDGNPDGVEGFIVRLKQITIRSTDERLFEGIAMMILARLGWEFRRTDSKPPLLASIPQNDLLRIHGWLGTLSQYCDSVEIVAETVQLISSLEDDFPFLKEA